MTTLIEQLRKEALTRAGVMDSLHDRLIHDEQFGAFWAMLPQWHDIASAPKDWFCADFVSGSRLEGSEAPTMWQPLPPAP